LNGKKLIVTFLSNFAQTGKVLYNILDNEAINRGSKFLPNAPLKTFFYNEKGRKRL
jgi:hypothetical protein